MANPNLLGSVLPRADAVNEAGGRAYRLTPRDALAQLAATGTFNGVYYASGADQLATVRQLVEQVDDNPFLAKLAVYARERAFMKDMPAALLLVLSRRDPALFGRAFPRVVDSGRVLRTFFQMVRSGLFGRRSLSYALQRAFQRWLNGAGVGALLSASIGNDPSLRDVLRLARPTPADNARRALFGWLTGKPADKWAPATAADLPAEVQDLRAFRAAQTEEEQVEILQRARFRWDLLADSARGPLVWKAIARQMGAQALRMNLNTLQRHGVFDDPEMVEYVAGRLADDEEVRRSRQFPYQYFAAFLNAEATTPDSIRAALELAAEAACGNVPALAGPVVIGVDVSGSMSMAVTGARGHSSKVRCVDVAALFAAAILRRNPGSVIVPFDTRAHHADVPAGQSILNLAARLSRYGGGGTNCAVPLAHANEHLADRTFAGCILLSDNESWVGSGRHGSTAVMTQWARFAARQPGAKLVCIDLQPYATAQAPERDDILNVGGFSDAVFDVVAGFLREGHGFVREVEAVEL
jgi:60 kDa SS-A/Ro ribonucleoprotein